MILTTNSAQKLHILKKINILMPKVHQTCIYSKKSKKWSSKVTKPAYTQKNQKNQKLIHLCQSVPHRVWKFVFFYFFEYMQVWWLFPIKTFDFFEYMQVWGTWSSRNLHILKKNQHFDAKSAQNLHILKKIKKNDRQKSPNLHILKKIKKIKN